jgi:ankyrin repeat protein/uncharacterized protein YegL
MPREDLLCPITLELLEDPITVPCCGKACSRAPLVHHLSVNQRTCPMCRGDLSVFDAETVATNVVLKSLIEDLHIVTLTDDKISQPHKYEASLTHIAEHYYKFQLRLDHSQFAVKPSLFIAVVDTSGSMAGSPINQVKEALIHIMSMAHSNPNIEVIIVTYDNFAQLLPCGGTPNEIKNTINTLSAGGGTNFNAAFDKVLDVCYTKLRNIADTPPGSLTIAFLTDGQDGSGIPIDQLTHNFKDKLSEFTLPISTHAIGFSHGCNKDLLEQVRLAGNTPGTFRFCEPSDGADALCQRLTGVFEISSKSSSVKLQLKFIGDGDILRHEVKQFPIDQFSRGDYTIQIELPHMYANLTVTSVIDQEITIPINEQPCTDSIMYKFIKYRMDVLAETLLGVADPGNEFTDNTRALACALLKQKIRSMKTTLIMNPECDITHHNGTFEFMLSQIELIAAGTTVDIGRLRDLKYNSQFATQAPKKIINSIQTVPKVKIKKLMEKPYNEPPCHHYSRNVNAEGRNKLQVLIMKMTCGSMTDELKNEINDKSVAYTDSYNNNALHLAAYCGHVEIVKYIIDNITNIDLEQLNSHNETAVTLAIKKRGFHRTLGVLLGAGANIPRQKALERYAIDHKFVLTANIVGRFDKSVDVDVSMSTEYIMFQYQKAHDGNIKIDSAQYLYVAMHKQMLDLTRMMLNHPDKPVPTIDDFFKYAIPPKPDCEDPIYMEMAKLLLEHHPDLVNQTNEAGETALFHACETGNLPHVRFFTTLNQAAIDQPNKLGNTPLWIASSKRYPCIMEALIIDGADPNHANEKGNTPLYGVCQKGPVKIAQQLHEAGAEFDNINKNKDSLLLIACRNKQHEIVEYMLNYVDPEFVYFQAHIDGFDAIMACAEADSPDCLQVLVDYGISIESKTDDDNAILAGATPLHLAAYYNRLNIAKKLIELEADINSPDINGQTPMHIAVIQGNAEFVNLLHRNKASLTMKDNAGNIPMSYCKDPNIKKALIDPAQEILMKLAQGGFDRDETTHAIDRILYRYVGEPGCLSQGSAISIADSNDMTPLKMAVIHSNIKLTEALLGFKPILNDVHPTVYEWAYLTKNKKIMKLLTDYIPQKHEGIKRAVFPMMQIRLPPAYAPRITNSISTRMSNFINAIAYDPITNYENAGNAVALYNKGFWGKHIIETLKGTRITWHAQIDMIRQVYEIDDISSIVQFVMNVYTNNHIVAPMINKELIEQTNDYGTYTASVIESLKKLPRHVGECFVGSREVNRALFVPDTTFHWAGLRSASQSWKIALDNTESFETNKGTVFLIHSKNGHQVLYSTDLEIIFSPLSTFKITNWYRGDVIALGQANIREHTFKLAEEEIEDYTNSNRALIIELTEQ